MKKHFSPKLFITFSLITLLLGVFAVKYLTTFNQSGTIAESYEVPVQGLKNSTCYTETEDPFVTKVNPVCK
jgi:hypothetical protein